jgi:chemotaxis protein histidine kinase CheA
MSETQKQNQQKQNVSETALSEREKRLEMVEKRISETSETPTSETEKPSYLEPKTETFPPPSTETPTGMVEAEKTETPTGVEKPPEAVERFIELRLKGLSVREALRASKLSGYMYTRWRDYIDKRLEEAGLKKTRKDVEDIKRGVDEAERIIKETVGDISEGERTERMKVIDQLAAEVEHARRLLPKIAYGFTEPKPEEAKAEKKAEAEEKPEEAKAEKPKAVEKSEPMLIPIKEIRHPDGRVEIQFSLGPDYYRVVRQTDLTVEKLVPELIGEVKETRRDISNIGNRLFTLIENYWGPQLKKIQPWTYFPIPITQRSPLERERELEEYERRLAEKTPPKEKAEEKGEKG